MFVSEKAPDLSGLIKVNFLDSKFYKRDPLYFLLDLNIKGMDSLFCLFSEPENEPSHYETGQRRREPGYTGIV